MAATEQVKTASGPQGLQFLRLIANFYADRLQTLSNVAAQHGSVVRFQLGSYAVHQIFHPDHIRYVLQDNNRNYRISGRFDETKPVVGRGLTTSDGDDWLWARRLMQPLFGKGQVAVFLPAIQQATEAMLERWSAHGSSDLMLYPEMLSLNHIILGKILFNVQLDGADSPVLHALQIVREYSNQRISAIVTVPTKWPTPRNRRFWSAVEMLDNFAYDLIAAARKKDTPTDDMLSLLLRVRDEKGVGMTDTQIHDELMTLFFAAYEDPANALFWALALLGDHPEVVTGLRAEIETVLGYRQPTFDDLPDLVLTHAVVEEALRLYPPAWSLMRDLIEDDTVGGYSMKAGGSVLINIYLAHRHPDFWEAPDEFRPERFLPQQTVNRPRFAYLPFGGGPHQCIAAALAIMQVKTILAMIIQRYHIEWVSPRPIRPVPNHSLRPDERVLVRLIPR